ncbi:MAG: SGNH/GDSL hydrolase family protein [Pseudomonadota bacterium]
MLYQLGRALSHASISKNTPSVVDISAKTIAILGDSTAYQNTSSNGLQYLSQGFMGWVNLMTGQKYHFPTDNNLGIDNADIADVDSAKTNLASLSNTPDIVFVITGTKDTSSSTTETEMINGLQSIYNYITNTIGAKVVALTIPPRTKYSSSDSTINGAPLDSGKQIKLEAVNNWILSQTGDIIPVDIYSSLILAGTTSPDPDKFEGEGIDDTAYLYPNPLGAQSIANAIKIKLDNYFGPFDIPDMSINNLSRNPDLSGTGGINNSHLTGDLAEYYYAVTDTGASGILSKPTSTSQQINVSFTNQSSSDDVQFYPYNLINYSVGDQVIGEAEIEIISGQNVEGIWIEVKDKGSSNITYLGLNKYSEPKFPTTPGTYMFSTPIFTVQSSNTALTLKIRAELNSSGGKTANLNMIVKQVRGRIVT